MEYKVMEYKVLAERIKCPNIQKCPFEKNEMSCKQCQYKICDEAATAIIDLLARAEAAEARAEKAEMERDEFKKKWTEAVERACELSKIVDDHGWEE